MKMAWQYGTLLVTSIVPNYVIQTWIRLLVYNQDMKMTWQYGILLVTNQPQEQCKRPSHVFAHMEASIHYFISK